MIGIAYAFGFVLLCAFVMSWSGRRHVLLGSAAVLGLGVLFFTVVFPGVRIAGVTIPGLAMLATGATLPLPVPAFAFWTYIGLICVGIALVVSASDDSLEEFFGPIYALLAGELGPRGLKLRKPLLFGVAPVLVGGLTFGAMLPPGAPPTAGRQAHPSIPYDEGFVNPLRSPTAAMLAPYGGDAEAFTAAMVMEGRHLYAKNCSPCHSGEADGAGHLARALTLPPANFTDPGTIATLVEGYAFKRIQDGGIGLPAAGTPWDSAMPRWKGELTDGQIHRILLAEYDLAGVTPRVPEKLE